MLKGMALGSHHRNQAQRHQYRGKDPHDSPLQPDRISNYLVGPIVNWLHIRSFNRFSEGFLDRLYSLRARRLAVDKNRRFKFDGQNPVSVLVGGPGDWLLRKPHVLGAVVESYLWRQKDEGEDEPAHDVVVNRSSPKRPDQ